MDVLCIVCSVSCTCSVCVFMCNNYPNVIHNFFCFTVLCQPWILLLRLLIKLATSLSLEEASLSLQVSNLPHPFMHKYPHTHAHAHTVLCHTQTYTCTHTLNKHYTHLILYHTQKCTHNTCISNCIIRNSYLGLIISGVVSLYTFYMLSNTSFGMTKPCMCSTFTPILEQGSWRIDIIMMSS